MKASTSIVAWSDFTESMNAELAQTLKKIENEAVHI